MVIPQGSTSVLLTDSTWNYLGNIIEGCPFAHDKRFLSLRNKPQDIGSAPARNALFMVI